MIETRELNDSARPDVVAVANALPEWFDQDARTGAIPMDLKHQHGLVAVSDGRIVGFITLYFAEGRLNIGWLGVLPEHHRRGVGAKLIECAESFGKQRGLSELATYTLGGGVDYAPYEATRAFYFSQGFSIHQTSKTDNPGCPEEIEIRKSISGP